MLEINYTCSFGNMCQSSQILKRNNLKLCSYPFDWIFSNYDNIIHCIEDDFKIFLDKSYYSTVNNNTCKHTYYYKKESEYNMFNHFNPLDNEKNYNYYIRCVNRFRDLLQKQEHKLFIMININNNDDDKNNIINKTINFNNTFSKYTSNYTILFIFHVPNKQTNNHTFTYIDNIHFLELHTLSRSSGVNFDNSDDNIYLDNIIKSNYTLHKT